MPLACRAVSAGGRGADNIRDLKASGANIVALCDCDANNARDSFAAHPEAKKYSDWRKLLEDAKSFDAVLVSTPDHNHAIISVAAMKLGKHVYCEKPLAYNIWETRLVRETAAKNPKLSTQMGNQGHASASRRSIKEILDTGAIGKVTEVHVWAPLVRTQGAARPAR